VRSAARAETGQQEKVKTWINAKKPVRKRFSLVFHEESAPLFVQMNWDRDEE